MHKRSRQILIGSFRRPFGYPILPFSILLYCSDPEVSIDAANAVRRGI